MPELKKQTRIHEPVLLGEVRKALRLESVAPLNIQARPAYAGRFIDATVGTGGHSLEIVKRKKDLIGIDVDSRHLEVAGKRLKKACPVPEKDVRVPFKLVQGNFAKIDEIAKKHKFENVDGILFDLGVSSLHFEDNSRGFSFKNRSAPLDMRFDQRSQGVTASDLLNSLRNDQLQELFEVVLDRRFAKKLTEKVVESRAKGLIKTVGDFLEIVKGVIPTRGKLHPATLPFLAVRIAVNSELENLKEALPRAFSLLKARGRLVIISFHSGEDREVKSFFRKMQRKGYAKVITKKPILPTKAEIAKNPRARSAKMRVLEKV